MAKDSNLVWQDVDLDTLTPEMRKAYEAYKVAQREAAQLRTAFEDMVNKHMPDGQRMVFGYRFGKLSAAITDDAPKAKAASKPAMSLTAFLASQKAAGART